MRDYHGGSWCWRFAAVAVAWLAVFGVSTGWAEEDVQQRVRLQQKMDQVQALVPRWAAAGGDHERIRPLGEQVEPLVQAGKFAEADAVLDRILAIISLPSAQSSPLNTAPIPADAAILFWSTRGVDGATPLGPSNLYVMDAQGGNVTQITSMPSYYEHANLSFDHRYIAANRYLDAAHMTSSLWVIDLEGQTETQLVPAFLSAGGGGFSWSRDGFIYFAGRPQGANGSDIFKVRPDGSGLHQVTSRDQSEPGFESDIRVSDDGSLISWSKIVARRGSDGRMHAKPQIWVMASDGTNPRMIDDGGPEVGEYGGVGIGDFDPKISPDNRYVAFSRTNTHYAVFKDQLNTAQDIWVAPLDGSAPARRVTAEGAISIVPEWLGETILYTEYNEQEGYVGLVTINPDGTGKKRLESHPGHLWDGGRHGKPIP